MQPSPMAETSRLLFPSLRFCIGFSFRVSLAGLIATPFPCRVFPVSLSESSLEACRAGKGKERSSKRFA